MWKIALVDDDIQTLEGMKHIIPWDLLNATCIGEFLDGQAMLDAYPRLKPDLIITDIYMPNMDGLEMIVNLRSGGYSGNFLILSGYSDFEYAQKALRLQVSDYLTKPISPATIKESVLKVLSDMEKQDNYNAQEQHFMDRMKRLEQCGREEWLRGCLIHTNKMLNEQMVILGEGRYNQEDHYLAIGLEIVRNLRIQSFRPVDLRLIRYGLQNIARELLDAKEIVYDYVDLHSYSSVIVLPIPRDVSNIGLDILPCLREIVEVCKGYLTLEIQVGIGSVVQGWDQLYKTSEEAFQSISFKINEQQTGIYRYECNETTWGLGMQKPFYPLIYYQQIAEWIQSSRRNETYTVLSSFMEYLRSQPSNGMIQPYKIAMELAMHIKHVLYVTGMAHISFDYYPNAIRTLNELEHWMIETIDTVCSEGRGFTNTRHRQTVEYMVQYVADHFAEDINTNMIAAKLYMSRNHAANIFREAMGESFTSYLVKYRMNKAKEMILSGKFMIYEIAEHVGYKNVPYFSTLFKKHTGLNPSEFLG